MNSDCIQQTRTAFIWTSILNAPFWALFNMLPFILYKDLHATPFQITILITLKPCAALLSPYWSALIEKRPDQLRANIIWARLLSHVPFFFFPFVNNIWFFVGAFGFYMLLARGTIPAWMEILKQNVPSIAREQVFAYGSAFGYVGTAILPFIVGPLMDTYFEAWRWLFPITALISLFAIYFKASIPVSLQKSIADPSSIKHRVLHPWRSAWNLLGRRSDFCRFQLGFMLGGSGLILIQPALPFFFVDALNLSYTELAVALTLCKGIAMAVSSPLWARWMAKVNIFNFTAWVTLLAAAFPILLLMAKIQLAWLYFAYLVYGFMQAGSEMSWNLSGPVFAKEEDSSIYSSINVLSVGIRGAVIPLLGSLILTSYGSLTVMVIGTLLCATAYVSLATENYRSQVA